MWGCHTYLTWFNVVVLTKSGKFLNNRLLTMLGTFSKSRTFLDGTIINSANSIMAPSDLLNFDINMFGDHSLFLSLMALVMPSNREFWILSIKLNAMWLWRAQSFNYFITQWKFSSQKGMKINFLAKAGLEPATAEFPQKVTLTIEPRS